MSKRQLPLRAQLEAGSTIWSRRSDENVGFRPLIWEDDREVAPDARDRSVQPVRKDAQDRGRWHAHCRRKGALLGRQSLIQDLFGTATHHNGAFKMKDRWIFPGLVASALAVLLVAPTLAAVQGASRNGCGPMPYVERNGTGQYMRDHDGDGIPNGLDPDFTGQRFQGSRARTGFVDLNADGINDRAQDWDGDGLANCQDPDWQGPVGLGPRGSRGTGGKARPQGAIHRMQGVRGGARTLGRTAK
jgi:hypothetical protein